ncbi:heptaprenylglyceryl phosphate synthase [Effusibacillus dendaii]|uniref:Heptaprenylglyceryl phosphate synthase n=1 Tax=Effusibacillus dendaii TaxID=2743772 RepID=A0A7I8DAB8_9BACL|nr:heptaprenylglyceryl phosphate synthase [Effusibacillus dendaii]BCJ87133.1 geranylgeranylglyceryl/heptaprenylglyceryl phosphate synthase [Effusibacillus dendaii]
MSCLQHPWKSWRHIVKLDPDRPIQDKDLIRLGDSGTDAILIGGTQGITYQKTFDLFARLQRFIPHLPLWQEISELSAILPESDGYAIPVVLNTGHVNWIIGHQKAAIEQFGELIPWEKLVVEGYVILNENSAVAKLTGAKVPNHARGTVAYAQTAERIFGMDLIYLEYSGSYGNPQWVQAVRDKTNAHLVYGGGIDSADKAVEMASIADTIVVGNALYEKGIAVVEETAAAVHSINKKRTK